MDVDWKLYESATAKVQCEVGDLQGLETIVIRIATECKRSKPKQVYKPWDNALLQELRVERKMLLRI